MKSLARGQRAKSSFSAFLRWFRIENRIIFAEVVAIHVQSVWMFTKLAVSLSKMVRFSIRNHRWKAQKRPYQLNHGVRLLEQVR